MKRTGYSGPFLHKIKKSQEILDNRTEERHIARHNTKISSAVKTPIFLGQEMDDEPLKRRVERNLAKMNIPGVLSDEALYIVEVENDYAEEIVSCENNELTIVRRLEHGIEKVTCPMPAVVTVNGSAAECRPRHAKLVMKYKRAMGAQEKAAITKEGAELPYADLYDKLPYLNITEWSVADVNGDTKQCGLSGSPTKVKKIENIIFQAKESKTLTGSDQDIEDLIVELLANHTIG